MPRKIRSDKGKARGPRSTEVKDWRLDAVRSRHIFCITARAISIDLSSGRIPNYDPKRYHPHCDHPEDGFCAAPDVPDGDVIDQLREQQEKLAER